MEVIEAETYVLSMAHINRIVLIQYQNIRKYRFKIPGWADGLGKFCGEFGEVSWRNILVEAFLEILDFSKVFVLSVVWSCGVAILAVGDECGENTALLWRDHNLPCGGGG